MRGLVLAGGAGTRLNPVTRVVNKQLLPVYDKPMVYYPLSVLMLAGIRDILLVSTPLDRPLFERLLGDGAHLGMRIEYAEQPHPAGIADAYVLGREFVGDEPSALILGDNIFYGHGLPQLLRDTAARTEGATAFAYWVSSPERYGVVAFDEDGTPAGIVEKPTCPTSNWAVTGCYFFDGEAASIAAGLSPSARGELEITDLLNAYLDRGRLRIERLGRGYAWLDTGTHDSLLQAAQFVQTVEHRQGLKISCPEEIALRMGFIDLAAFEALARREAGTAYGDYLARLARGHR